MEKAIIKIHQGIIEFRVLEEATSLLDTFKCLASCPKWRASYLGQEKGSSLKPLPSVFHFHISNSSLFASRRGRMYGFDKRAGPVHLPTPQPLVKRRLSKCHFWKRLGEDQLARFCYALNPNAIRRAKAIDPNGKK